MTFTVEVLHLSLKYRLRAKILEFT